MKLNAFVSNKAQEVDDKVRSHFRGEQHAVMILSQWKLVFQVLKGTNQDRTDPALRELVDTLGPLISKLMTFTQSLELALSSELDDLGTFKKNSGKVERALLRYDPGDDRELYDRLLMRAQTAQPVDEPYKAVEYALRKIDEILSDISRGVRRVDDYTAQYGNDGDRIIFENILWYEIADPKDLRSLETKIDRSKYFENIARLKKEMNGNLRHWRSNNNNSGDHIYFHEGGFDSNGREGYLLVSGEEGNACLKQFEENLFLAASESDLQLRAMVMPTTALGDAPFRYSGTPDIRGQSFLDQLRQLKTWIVSAENGQLTSSRWIEKSLSVEWPLTSKIKFKDLGTHVIVSKYESDETRVEFQKLSHTD